MPAQTGADDLTDGPATMTAEPPRDPFQKSTTVADCRLITLPKIADARGNLTFVESNRHIRFDIQRAYWIYDVPGGEKRGGHGYRSLHEFAIALSGSFDVHVHDGREEQVITLNRSYFGLYIPPMIWR